MCSCSLPGIMACSFVLLRFLDFFLIFASLVRTWAWGRKREMMMMMGSSSSPAAAIPSDEDPKQNLLKQIRSHEVALGELNSVSSSRAVYQKNGNIFFQTSIKAAIASEQKQENLAKAQLQRLKS